MNVLFPPDLKISSQKVWEHFLLLHFFIPISVGHFVDKICIHYANFHDCNFLGKNCELMMMMNLIFHAHLNLREISIK